MSDLFICGRIIYGRKSVVSELVDDSDSHTASRAFNLTNGHIHIANVEIILFRFGDLFQLLSSDLTDSVFEGVTRTLGNLSRLLQQNTTSKAIVSPQNMIQDTDC